MAKKNRGVSVFTEPEVAALAKCMIFPEEGVGLYLDVLNQKMKEQSTKVSEVLKEAKLAPAQEEPVEPEIVEEQYQEPVRDENIFFQPEIEQEPEPVVEETQEEVVIDEQPTYVIEEAESNKSSEEELASRGLEEISQELLKDETNFNNFIINFDFLKNEGIDLDSKKIEKTFASLALADPNLLQQSYGTIIGNGYSIVKPNGNLTLTSLLISPSELESKFDILRNVDAGDFYKLYPEYISLDATEIANRISYCQNNNIEYKTDVNGKEIYLPVILVREEFEKAGGVL